MSRSNTYVLLAAVVPPILLGGFASFQAKSAAAFLLIPLALVAGPFMAVTYPWSPLMTGTFVLAFIGSAIAFLFAIKFRTRPWAPAVIVLASATWTFCGVMGLGTGT
jgi:hypothetical protein